MKHIHIRTSFGFTLLLFFVMALFLVFLYRSQQVEQEQSQAELEETMLPEELPLRLGKRRNIPQNRTASSGVTQSAPSSSPVQAE